MPRVTARSGRARGARRRVATLTDAERERLAYAALRPLVRLLRASGCAPATVRALIQRALHEHRHERARGHLAPGTSRPTLLGPAATVVSAWVQDPRWSTAEGQPAELSLSPRSTQGFAALVAAAAPETQPDVMLADLLRSRTVRRLSAPKRVRLISRAVQYVGAREFDVVTMLTHLRRFQETVERNVLESRSPEQRLFERAAHAFDLPAKHFADFERDVWRQAAALINQSDQKLTTYRQQRSTGPRSTFGVGVYLFRDPPPKSRGPRKPGRKP